MAPLLLSNGKRCCVILYNKVVLVEIDFALPQKNSHIVYEINGQAANFEYQTLNKPPQYFLGSYTVYFTFKNVKIHGTVVLCLKKKPVCDRDQKPNFKTKYCMQHIAAGATVTFSL